MPVRPMGLGELLDGAFKLLRADFARLLLAVGVVVVPTQLLLSFIGDYLVFGPLETLDVGAQQPPEAFESFLGDLARGIPAFVTVALLQTLLLLLATAAVVSIGAARYLGGQQGPADALRTAGRRFPVLLGSQVLVALILIAAVTVPLVLVVAGAFLGQDALAAVGGLAFLPLIPLAVYLYIAFALAVPAIMLEGTGAVAALRRSSQLVKGRWWPVFGILVVAWIVVGIVGSALGVIPSALAGAFENQSARALVSGIGASITGLLTEPVTALVVLLLYFDTRIRKEGFDLEMRNRAATSGEPFEEPGALPRPGEPWVSPGIPGPPSGGALEQPGGWPGQPGGSPG
ncbi:MAG: hypothetical protein GEU81_13735 [Nitriliruptorales bacterium]|nr:hypothetical protein [Nitriliruptorales bacterium]